MSRVCSRFSIVIVVTLACLTLCATRALAQVGETADIIAGVEIVAFSRELEVARTGITARSGKYTILFPDGGGQYRLTARLIGPTPQSVIIVRHADEDRLIWDVQVPDAAYMLDSVVATGDWTVRRVRIPERRQPPARRNSPLPPHMVASLPIDAADLAILAAHAPALP
jgi:hypothetical protein